MRRSVALACEARKRFWADAAARGGRSYPLVAASVGPYGATLHDGSEYRGNYGLDVDALVEFHRPRMAVLASAGADLLACETLPRRDEALALALLLPEFPTTQAWISFSCRDGVHVSRANRSPVHRRSKAARRLPRSASLHRATGTSRRWSRSPRRRQSRSSSTRTRAALRRRGDVLARRCRHNDACEHASKWYRLGARLIGGCCRTTPAIHALRAWSASATARSVSFATTWDYPPWPRGVREGRRDGCRPQLERSIRVLQRACVSSQSGA
jgi:homocysteine S-methyltransferase